MGKEWISASDVEKYGYCPLSWWLSRDKQEVVSESLEEGVYKHEEIGEAMGEVKVKEEKSGNLENIILWLAVAASIVSIMGLTFLHPEKYFNQIFRVLSLIWLIAATFFLYISESGIIKDEKFTYERIIVAFAMVATLLAVFGITLAISDKYLARLSQIVSLLLLIGASYWLKRSLDLEIEAKQTRDELSVDEGDVEYVDTLKKKSKMFRSERFGLRGRPDYILKKDDEQIPVEVKTGRVPKGPFFSHILQIAAYSLLLEEENDQAPSHGVIKYGEKEFEIDYDDSLRELLLEKLEDMRDAIETEDVHRHHNREGKCANCSRREICPESLA